VVACLDGLLLLQPQGCAPTVHDVVRLRPDVRDIGSQQGDVCCEPLPQRAGGPLAAVMHFTVKVGRALRRWWGWEGFA
jgi:hypothetical protein